MKTIFIGNRDQWQPLNSVIETILGRRDGAMVRALVPHQCDPGFDSWTWHHMWLEFVVASLLCSKRFFSGNSSFPLSSKTNTSGFHFNLECLDV